MLSSFRSTTNPGTGFRVNSKPKGTMRLMLKNIYFSLYKPLNCLCKIFAAEAIVFILEIYKDKSLVR